MSKIKEVQDVGDKKVASFDVKSLFTNVPVSEALKAIGKVVEFMNEDELPLPKNDFLELVSLCMEFACFSYNIEEYVQHSGLAMG